MEALTGHESVFNSLKVQQKTILRFTWDILSDFSQILLTVKRSIDFKDMGGSSYSQGEDFSRKRNYEVVSIVQTAVNIFVV